MEPISGSKKVYHILYPAINLSILALWCAVFRGTFIRSWHKFSEDFTFTGAAVFIFVSLFLAYKFISTGSYRRFFYPPRLNFYILAGITGVTALHLANLHFMNMNIISAVLLIIGTYLIFCLYFPEDWSVNSIMPLLLLLSALPVGYYLEMVLGFPLRVWSAGVVRGFLESFDIHAATREAIIFIDSRAAKIDISCSGMRGLWAGFIFYFGISWLNRKKPGVKWAAGLVSTIILIIAANIARITALTIIDTLLGLKKIAGIVHEPLGIAGFISACVVSYFMFLQPEKSIEKEKKYAKISGSLPAAIYIILVMAAGLFLYKPRQYSGEAAAGPGFICPEGVYMEQVGFTSQEKAVFDYEETPFAGKYSFSHSGISGSVLIVLSRSWRAQHNPVFCLQGMGLKMDSSGPFLISKNFPVILCRLDNGKNIATFWYQNESGATDDYTARIFSEFSGVKKDWVMISVLFDRPYDTGSKDFLDLHKIIFDNINKSFWGGGGQHGKNKGFSG